MLGMALILALIALFLTGGFVLLRGTPAYYRVSTLTLEQRAQAAEHAESKLSQMQNIAVDAHGAEVQKLRGVTQPTTEPGATTFSFTDDELNAAVQQVGGTARLERSDVTLRRRSDDCPSEWPDYLRWKNLAEER